MFTFVQRFAWFRRDDSPRGRALHALEKGHYAEAEAQLSVLLDGAEWANDRALLLNKRGVARIRLGRRDEARADFHAALEAQARHAPALTNLGNMLLEDGSLDEAIGQYEAAIRADEEYALAHQNLGVAYRRKGRFADAVRELRKAQRLEGRFFGKPRKRA